MTFAPSVTTIATGIAGFGAGRNAGAAAAVAVFNDIARRKLKAARRRLHAAGSVAVYTLLPIARGWFIGSVGLSCTNGTLESVRAQLTAGGYVTAGG